MALLIKCLKALMVILAIWLLAFIVLAVIAWGKDRFIGYNEFTVVTIASLALCMVALVLSFVALLIIFIQTSTEKDNKACARCGYSLEGLGESSMCPECGLNRSSQKQ